jgi:hypothetical protein
MSDFENPYQRPESPIIPEKPQGGTNSLNSIVLSYLKETSPWLRFIGILGFIGCGLMCFGGIIVTMAMLFASSLTDGFGTMPVWLFPLIYLPFGVLFYFPSRYTYNFGAKLRNYQFSNSDEDLEQAFKNNRSLWKFYGILCIIYLALVPLTAVLTVIGGAFAAITGLFS